MKVLKKANILKQQEVEHTLAERSILKSIKHPFMINLKFSFQTETKLYLVLDFVCGGELFFHLQRMRRFPYGVRCWFPPPNSLWFQGGSGALLRS
jgi:serine/threonine protein kinase